jgi:cobalt-precorrin-7 (C5)-methyltransferase
MLYIVGLGPGSKDYILPKAVQVLENSDMVIGFQRALSSIDFLYNDKHVVRSLEEIISYSEDNRDKNISVVASGDPCFYGITDFINKNYKGSFRVVPGISSFQYLCAKLNKPWQGSFLGSLHGRKEDFLERVKENNISIWLTDKTHTPGFICSCLSEAKLKVVIYVGEDLSYEDEKITIGEPEKFINTNFSELNLVIIERL